MSEFVKAMDAGLAGRLLRKFNEDEPRDEGGKWTEGGGSAGAAAEGAKDEKSHGEAAKYHAAQAARAKSEGRHEAAKQHDRAARSHALAASVHHDTKRFFAPADKETATRATANAQRNSQWAHADDKKGKFAEALMLKYSEDQARDEGGRFAGGGETARSSEEHDKAAAYHREQAAAAGKQYDEAGRAARSIDSASREGMKANYAAMKEMNRLSTRATVHTQAAQAHRTASTSARLGLMNSSADSKAAREASQWANMHD